MFFPIDLKVFCLISVTKTKIKKLFLYKENKKKLKKKEWPEYITFGFQIYT